MAIATPSIASVKSESTPAIGISPGIHCITPVMIPSIHSAITAITSTASLGIAINATNKSPSANGISGFCNAVCERSEMKSSIAEESPLSKAPIPLTRVITQAIAPVMIAGIVIMPTPMLSMIALRPFPRPSRRINIPLNICGMVPNGPQIPPRIPVVKPVIH